MCGAIPLQQFGKDIGKSLLLMAIILDANNMDQKSYLGYLEYTLFTNWIKSLPNEQFLIPFQSANIDLPLNTKQVVFPFQKGLFALSKTEKWLKTHEAKVFVSFRRTIKRVKPLIQVLIIDAPTQWVEKNFQNADFIGFVTATLQQQFIEKFPNYSSRCFLLKHIVQQNVQNEKNHQATKAALSDGKEYFISADFDLRKEKFVTLLKGFSVFKKRQQSSWKLMVVLRSTESVSEEDAAQLIANYKYREDVILTNDNQLMEKMAAAHLLITSSDNIIYPIPIAEAVQNHIPVIAKATNTVEEIFENMVLHTDMGHSQTIGNQLMLLYKDEKLWSVTANKTMEKAASISLSKTLHELNQLLAIT